jgi:hypothetical protein
MIPRTPRPKPPIGTLLPCPHQLPAGWSAQLRVTGYGILLCALATPHGEFHGSGLSDWEALSSAQVVARRSGVTVEGRAR